MNQKGSFFIKFIKYIFYFYVLFGPAIPIIFGNLNPIITYLMGPAWISLVLNLLYDNNDRFYFWATKNVMWLANTNVDWSLAVDFDGDINQNTIEEIYAGLLSFFKNAKPWINQPLEKVIELTQLGCNIHLHQVVWVDGVGDSYSTLRVYISD